LADDRIAVIRRGDRPGRVPGRPVGEPGLTLVREPDTAVVERPVPSGPRAGQPGRDDDLEPPWLGGSPCSPRPPWPAPSARGWARGGFRSWPASAPASYGVAPCCRP